MARTVNMTRMLNPVKCTIDGNIWDREGFKLPPCEHTDAEWEAHRQALLAAGKTDEEARARWTPEPPLETSIIRTEENARLQWLAENEAKR